MNSTRSNSSFSCFLRWLTVPVFMLASTAAFGQIPAEQTPVEFEGVGLVERRGEPMPLDVQFVDEQGRSVRLGDYFDGEQPVILTPNYYRCPMLCNLILNGMVDALNQLDLAAGEDFQIVTFSFNPEEGPELAEVKKRAYLTQYEKESAKHGWHFLTGTEPNIKRLTQAMGYGYRRDPKTGEYAHPSTIAVLTPDGRISVYLDDTVFDPKDIRLALVEASEGSIGSPLDKIALFFCFQYDPDSNSYKVVAWKVMRSGGLLTLMVLVGGLGALWLKEYKGRVQHGVAVSGQLTGGSET